MRCFKEKGRDVSFCFIPPSQPSPRGEGARSLYDLGETGRDVKISNMYLIEY
jgi:hypothetical protein